MYLPSGSARALLAYAPLTFILIGLNLLALSAVLEYAIPALGLSNTEAGLVISVFALTYALMQIPAGRWSDRWGGGPIIRLCAVAASGLAVAFSFANDFWSAFVMRGLLGVASGTMVPATVQVLASNFRGRDLDRANGVFVAGWGGSQVLIFAVVPPLILAGDWRLGLHFVTGVTFGVAVVAWLLLPGRRPSSSTTSSSTPKRSSGPIFTRDMISLILAHLTGLAVSVGVLAWAPLFLANRLQAGTVTVGLVVTIFGVTNLLGAFVGGELTRYMGRRPIVVLSMLLCIGSVPLFLLAGSIVTAAIVAAALGWATTFYSGPVFAQIPEASPRGVEGAGLLFGVLNTVANLGVFLTPFLVGLLLDLTGTFESGFLALTAFSGLGVIGAILFRTLPAPERP